MRRLRSLIIAALVGIAPIASVQAALLDRGGGLIYDDVLNVTWLQDANYARTSGYDSDGFMTWYEASAWVEQLKYAGYSDWRLPTVGPVNPEGFNYTLSFDGSTDHGYGITSPASEMAYMYYVNLGNLAGCTADSVAFNCINQPGGGLTNTGPFNNLWYAYWSGTDSAVEDLPGQPAAFIFGVLGGSQTISSKGSSEYYAWAVRSGDVSRRPPPWAGRPDDTPPPWAGRPDSTPPIPEPGSMVLLLAGLGLLGVLRRHRASEMA